MIRTHQPNGWTIRRPIQLLVNLGELTPGSGGSISALNGDGSIGVGFSSDGSVSTPMVWDALNGLRDLQEILIAAGVDLTDWDLQSASSISDDGSVIVGVGVNPDGITEGWMVTEYAIPEPGTWAMIVGCAALISVLLCRNHRRE